MMFKINSLFVSLAIAASVTNVFAENNNIYGVYQAKNGSVVEIKNQKDEYGNDIYFHFKKGECDIESSWSKKSLRGNVFKVEDNQGYGMMLYYKAVFKKNSMDLIVTDKFTTDNGCEYNVDHKLLSGNYKKIK